MFRDQAIHPWGVRSGKKSSQAGGVRKKATGNVSAAASQPPPEHPSDIHALRKERLEYLESAPEERRKKMRYVGETIARVPATRKDVQTTKKATTVRKRKRNKATTVDSKHSHKQVQVNVRTSDESDEGEWVYRQPSNTAADDHDQSKAHIPDATVDDRDAPAQSKARRKASVGNKQEREEKQIPKRRQSEPLRRRNSHGTDECAPVRRKSASRGHIRRALAKSTTGIPDKPEPSAQQTATSLRSRTEVQVPRSSTGSEHAKKASSIFSRILPPTPVVSEKKVSCLTCGSDSVLISRSAKLACSHRMCHECLRRIFTMSVSDPAHMPPRCCTSEHIPLRHVDKLFDQHFKKTWNRKFQEYTTRNRIYCPARGCGEWIKPNHITVEHGRKVGKCKRCNTRVCCTCNNKMHTSRDCPKDPATREFVEIAKQEGWQRCYSCSAMVELKEGCNHMTCRCTAEFCMVCGLRWKSCDCPWFNYENIDARLGNPIRYQEELDRRREQEQRDEILARRMEVLGVEAVDDGLGGVRNAANRRMNEDFVRQVRDILTGDFRQAGPAAERLVNRTVTGRENPVPGLVRPRHQTPHLLRQQSQRGSADVPPPLPSLRRHAMFRRRNANPADGHRYAPDDDDDDDDNDNEEG